ncbi:unnamed protein product [Calypogeia fissa]
MPDHRPSWRDTAFKRPIFAAINPELTTEEEPVNIVGVPLTGLDTTVIVSPHLIEAVESELYGDKIVLSFERNLSIEELTKWLDKYNQAHIHTILTLVEQLINSLIVVKISSPDPKQEIENLLVASPMEAINTFAAVNWYFPEFDPQNPSDFNQLVSIVIKKGSRFLFRFIETILKPVGKLIRSDIEPRLDNHSIFSLVQTNLPRFIPQITFELSQDRRILIHLDYLGVLLRCYKCFAYTHLAASCDKNTHANIPVPHPTIRLQVPNLTATSPIHQAVRRTQQQTTPWRAPSSIRHSRPPRATPRSARRQRNQPTQTPNSGETPVPLQPVESQHLDSTGDEIITDPTAPILAGSNTSTQQREAVSGTIPDSTTPAQTANIALQQSTEPSHHTSQLHTAASLSTVLSLASPLVGTQGSPSQGVSSVAPSLRNRYQWADATPDLPSSSRDSIWRAQPSAFTYHSGINLDSTLALCLGSPAADLIQDLQLPPNRSEISNRERPRQLP